MGVGLKESKTERVYPLHILDGLKTINVNLPIRLLVLKRITSEVIIKFIIWGLWMPTANLMEWSGSVFDTHCRSWLDVQIYIHVLVSN